MDLSAETYLRYLPYLGTIKLPLAKYHIGS